MPNSARHQGKEEGLNIAQTTTEARGGGDSRIALTNFGERPRFPGGDGRRAHAGESARSDSGSGSIAELSEARSWRTGGTAHAGMSSGSVLGWGYSTMEKEVSRVPGSPTTATSQLSDGQLSHWTAKPGQRSNLGAPIMSPSSDTAISYAKIPRAPENHSTSSLTATQVIGQRQRQEGRSFSPARSDATGYSASEAAAYADRHKNSRSGGSGGYTHLTGGAPQPLKPPPRTERDKERERLEKIEREERERQERLANARYDLVGASRLPPPAYSTTTRWPSRSSSRAGDTYASMGIPPGNFDCDLEVARAGSPSNSTRSISARGTGATGSVRDHTPTPDLSAPQPGNRSYTPDDRTAGGGGRFTPERYNGSGRQQE